MLLPLRDNSSSQDSKSSSSGNRRELFKRPLFLLPLSNGYASPDGNCNRNKKDFPTFRWALGKQVKRVKKSSEEAALPHNRSSPPHHTHTHTGGCCVSLFFSRMQSHDSGAPLLFLHLPLSPHSVHTHTHHLMETWSTRPNHQPNFLHTLSHKDRLCHHRYRRNNGTESCKLLNKRLAHKFTSRVLITICINPHNTQCGCLEDARMLSNSLANTPCTLEIRLDSCELCGPVSETTTNKSALTSDNSVSSGKPVF